jgi:hypothetical protein
MCLDKSLEAHGDPRVASPILYEGQRRLALRHRTGAMGRFWLVWTKTMQDPVYGLPRISLPRTRVNKGKKGRPGRILALSNSLYGSRLLPDPFHIRDEALGFYQPPQSSL